MFILNKCDYEDCTRTGYVALKEHDTVCNIHKNAKKSTRDDNGKFKKSEESEE